MEGDVGKSGDTCKLDYVKQITDLAHWPQLLCFKQDFLACVSHFFVFDNGESTLVITKDDRIFVCGKNAKVKLSEDTSLDSDQPIEVTALSGKRVVEIAETYYDIFALTQNGDLYFWSQITDGNPMLILTGIIKLSVETELGNDNGAFAIDKEGNAWVLADNWLATEHITRVAPILLKKFCDCRIVDIQSNARLLWSVVTDDQFVHVFSQSDKVKFDISLKMDSDEGDIKSVIVYKFADGQAHLFVLLETGRLYQLVASSSEQVSKMKFADSIEHMIKVKSQILFATKSNKCYIIENDGDSLIFTSFRSIPDAISFYSCGSVILTKLSHELVCPEEKQALSQFNDPRTSDLTLMIDTTFGIKKIYVHQSVIQERFPALISKLSQSNGKEFKISSKNYGPYYTYFRWLYTKTVDAQEPWITDLNDMVCWSGDVNFQHEIKFFLDKVPTDHILQLYKSYCEDASYICIQGTLSLKKKRYILLNMIRERVNINTCCHIYECLFHSLGNEVMEFIAHFVRDKVEQVSNTEGYQQMSPNIRDELVKDSNSYRRWEDRYGILREVRDEPDLEAQSNESDYQSDPGAEDRLEEIEVPSEEDSDDDEDTQVLTVRDNIIEQLDEEDPFGSDISHPPSDDTDDDDDDGLDDDLVDHIDNFQLY